MARARNLKPALFKNEILGTADPIYTLLFEGLWMLADREGRLEDRPLRIKGEIFPYRDGIDTEQALTWLHDNGFIVRYTCDGARFIEISNFIKHQNPHKNEPESDIPAPTLRKSHRRSAQRTSENIVSPSDKIGAAPADSLLLIPSSLIPDCGLPGSGHTDPEPVEVEQPKPSKKFSPPEVTDVAAYCSERSNGVDPQKFVDFYASKGWRVGNQPMRDWKAAVRTWEGREQARSPPATGRLSPDLIAKAQASSDWADKVIAESGLRSTG